MTIKLSIDDLEPDRPPGTIGAPPGLFGGNRSAAPPAGGFQEELRRGTAMGLPPGFAPPLDDLALGRPFVVTGKSGVVVRGDASLDSSAVGEVKFGASVLVVETREVLRSGRVVERARLSAPVAGWCSLRLLALSEGAEDEDVARALALSLGESSEAPREHPAERVAPGRPRPLSGSSSDAPPPGLFSQRAPTRPGAPAAAAAARDAEPENAKKLFVGARVVVAGASRGGLDGAEGVVVLWNAGERRWGVALDDGSPVAWFEDGDLDHAERGGRRASWIDAALDAVGPETEICLLGESTHGTADYYAIRIALAKSLVELYGYTVVAVEGDFSSCRRVDDYVRGKGGDASAELALRGFVAGDGSEGTTPWLWRNKEVLAFVEWMRAHNEAAAATGAPLCGFVGLDLFCLDRSAQAVVDYLDSVDPHVADTAKHALAPFLFSSPDEYSVACASEARSDARGAADHADALRAACEALLSQLQANRYDYWDAGVDAADHFAAEQHAEVIVSAQQFYSKRLTEPDVTWSVRDQHMANALLRLRNQLEMIHGAPPRIVVFAHNSHVGDGRQTATGSQWNVGYLARETFGAAVRILGFSTFQGAVTAMPDGSRKPKRMALAPALPGSCERVLRDNFRYYPGPKCVDLRRPLPDDARVVGLLRETRPQRFVGVHYLRDDERARHYIDSNMAEQYDAVVYVDTTAALEPIDDVADWANGY